MDLAEAVAEVVARLTAAGIRATGDERDINPPCVYVGPPAVAWRFGRGDYSATFTATAVVPNSGRDIALRNLGALIETTAAALGHVVTSAEPADYAVPDQAAPLPGYRMTWTARIDQH